MFGIDLDRAGRILANVTFLREFAGVDRTAYGKLRLAGAGVFMPVLPTGIAQRGIYAPSSPDSIGVAQATA